MVLLRLFQYPPITDYTMKGRTYRYFKDTPLFPFGYGLSYSQFNYRSLDVRPQVVKYMNDLIVDVYVENVGLYDGEEVIF
jgi:beta-glucosidase